MAATSSIIQTNIYQMPFPRLVRDSSGNYYGVYASSTNAKLFVVMSTDGGESWSEEQIGSAITHRYCSIAVDEDDHLHLLYHRGSIGSADSGYFHREGNFGDWGDEEVVIDTSAYSVSREFEECALVVDNIGNIHANISVKNAGSYYCYYTIKSAGVWSAPTAIWPGYTSQLYANIRMIVDKNGYVWSFGKYSTTYLYWRYTDSLQTAVTFAGYTTDLYDIASDSSGNIYCLYTSDGTSSGNTRIVKFVAATGLWNSYVSIANLGTGYNGITLAVDSLDTIYAFRATDGSTWKMCTSTDGGTTWSAASTVLSGVAGGNMYPSVGLNLWFPQRGTSKPCRPYSGFVVSYSSYSGNWNWYFYASDGVTFDALTTKDYSRESATNLPTDDAMLTSRYTAADYINIQEDDGNTVDQTAADKYAIHLFKNKGTDATYSIAVSWTGETSVAPSASTVYLQIWNRTTLAWETLTSNNSSGAGVKFTLTGVKSTSLTDYYDDNLWVSCRVYQHS